MFNMSSVAYHRLYVMLAVDGIIRHVSIALSFCLCFLHMQVLLSAVTTVELNPRYIGAQSEPSDASNSTAGCLLYLYYNVQPRCDKDITILHKHFCCFYASRQYQVRSQTMNTVAAAASSTGACACACVCTCVYVRM
jgi:hypothetical protein